MPTKSAPPVKYGGLWYFTVMGDKQRTKHQCPHQHLDPGTAAACASVQVKALTTTRGASKIFEAGWSVGVLDPKTGGWKHLIT